MEKNVLFVVAESQPLIASGGLAEVAGSLPKAIMAKDKDKSVRVSVIMPLYQKIINEYSKKLKFVAKTNVSLAWRSQYCGLFKMKVGRIDYYFIDNKYYFDRENIYGYYDDGERYAFFSLAVLEVIPFLGFIPDVIHSHDWHSALTNVYLDVLYKKKGIYMNTKSIFTIHNIEYQGIYETHFNYDVIGLDLEYQELLEYNGLINLMKGAIVCSDLVTTVSPRYSREITTATYAHGLEYIIRTNNQKLVGIVNGINTTMYNPLRDQEIYINYGIKTFENKKYNKTELQKELSLEVNEDKCLISIISRLVKHKGMDLVIDRFHDIMNENVQFVILGTGEDYYVNKFKEFEIMYPGRVKTIIAFNTALSKKIYAASDLFLMPSKTEPCGLSQMIASRYGAIPICRATGGLYDTIKDYNDGLGNGFVFRDFDSYQMLNKIKEALYIYDNKDKYNKLVKKIMKIDFSWKTSAESYLKIYKDLFN